MSLSQARPQVEAALPVLRIEPPKGWVSLRLKELWQHRELLYYLTWRDVKVRYKQTALGVAWAVLQPLLTMLIFSLVFGRLAKIPSDGIPYPVFCLAGVVPWTFFSYGLAQSSNSLVANANMIKKIYFPRLAIPISAIISGAVDFSCAFLLLLCVMFLHGIVPSTRIVWLPAFFALAFICALGVGLWLAALNVKFRDVRYVVPFLVQFWMYATPIAYPSSLLKEPWRTVFGLNPMVGVIEGFRWCLLGTSTAPGQMIVVSALVTVLILIGGAFYFRRMEKTFADIV